MPEADPHPKGPPIADLLRRYRVPSALARGLLEPIIETGRQTGAFCDPGSWTAVGEAALAYGLTDLLDPMLANLPADLDPLSLTPGLQTLSAMADGNEGRLSRAMDRLRVAGTLQTDAATVLAVKLQAAGRADLTQQILGLIDADSLEPGHLSRLKPTLDRLEGGTLLKLWLTGNVTLAPMVPGLDFGLKRAGFLPQITLGQFGQMHQDLRMPDQGAAACYPDYVILGYDVTAVAPALAAARPQADKVVDSIQAGLDQLGGSIAAWRRHAAGGIILHTLPMAGLPIQGFADRRALDGAAAIQEAINAGLAQIAGATDGVYLLDLARLEASLGTGRFRDERRRFYGRFGASALAMLHWGIEAANLIVAIRKGPRKVLVCDCDDTLWGGIVGEVGPSHVQVGAEWPGNAFAAFQRTLLHCRDQGVLLALCSKNDPEPVAEVLANHPGMVLRTEDIVAQRVGWQPKPQYIRELADELNLGLSAFVFLDDSRQERAAVRLALPEVLVPELPADPVHRPAFLSDLRALWPVSVTESDRQRTALYQAQRQRRTLQASAGSVEEYLRSLGQVLCVQPIAEHEWTRVAQMFKRTNQFNTTTRRYDENVLRHHCRQGALIYTGSLRDLFGDQGLVITALIQPAESTWRIVALLMSCRAIGRQVEQAFARYLLSEAAGHGIKTIEAAFIPTDRNGPAAEVFGQLGFTRMEHAEAKLDDEPCQWWRRSVAGDQPEAPFVELEEAS